MSWVESAKKWLHKKRKVRELRQLAARADMQRRVTAVRLAELARIMARLDRVRGGMAVALENCSVDDRDALERLNRKNEIAFSDALNEYNKLRGEI